MAKNSNNQGFVYDAFDLIRFAWDKKWVLIIISVAAFLISLIVSLQIHPRFRSNVTMFPAASVSVSKNLVETNVITSDTKDILTFGEDEEAERLLQILYSDQVRDNVIARFNLMQHYKIDTSSRYPYTQLMNKYKSNVKFRRTQFLSIEISVLDEDAQMAADIANTIAGYIDSVFYNIKFSRAKEAYQIVEQEYNNSRGSISQMTDSLMIIRSFGINDYESQSEGLNQAYAEALGAGRTEILKTLQKQMDVMAKYGGIYVELSDKLEWEIERNSMLKAKLAAAKVNLESTMSNVFIVDKATKAERKATPKRSLIVIITTLSAFALALLLLLIIDNIKVRN
jgi:LPS O-antigen subunit length determinant protein (WzzB/FepE family)